MIRRTAVFFFVLAFVCTAVPQAAQPKFHVLAFYTEKTEADHVDFARQAVTFFEAEAKQDNFDWHVWLGMGVILVSGMAASFYNTRSTARGAAVSKTDPIASEL